MLPSPGTIVLQKYFVGIDFLHCGITMQSLSQDKKLWKNFHQQDEVVKLAQLSGYTVYNYMQECIRESTQLHTVSMASTFRLNDITFRCTSTRC